MNKILDYLDIRAIAPHIFPDINKDAARMNLSNRLKGKNGKLIKCTPEERYRLIKIAMDIRDFMFNLPVREVKKNKKNKKKKKNGDINHQK